MAGESPGREQQHETSGEAAERTAADPRLAVFRAPTATHGAARSVEEVPEEHAGASVGALVDDAPAHAPETADDRTSGARPHPMPASTSDLTIDTSDDVPVVDTVTDLPTPSNPPAPRSSGESAPKTEPNRDPIGGAEEADETAGTGGVSQETEGERATSADERADGAEPEDAEPEATEGGEPEDARPEGGAAEDGEPEGAAPERAPVEDARPLSAETEDAPPADARPESGEPGEARSEGAEPEPAAEPEAADVPAPTAEPADVPAPTADVPAPKPVVKPLVSDLPPEDRRGGGSSGSLTAYGTPGTPTRADPSPQAPAPGVRPGADRSAQPDVTPGASPVPLPPPAAKPSASGTGASAPLPPAATPPGEVVGPEGTRGMPVPPSPDAPLKLLAELTNTPPPPQTAIRTVVRRFKIWTPLVVLLALVFVLVQTLRPLPSTELDLTAASTYTFGGTPLPQSMPWPAQGQSAAEVEGLGSLGVRGAQTPVPIASVTKVMTAYLILRDHPLKAKEDGPLITVDAEAANESGSADESTAPVREGQKFTERQMLQLLLIPSGNNIARLLARWDAGTQQAFVAKMTKAAADLGMTRTTYTGASGFESSTKSTAADQLKLAAQVMKNDVFRSVVALANVKIPGVGTIYNNNNDVVNPGVIGIKTGSSTPAGGALMWAARKKVAGKEQLILGVTLQQRGGTTVYDSLTLALTNSQKLMTSVQNGLASATIVREGQVVGEIDDGLGGTTPVVAARDLTAVGWPGMKSGVTLSAVKGGLPHTAKAGTRVGTISFGSGPARTSVPVVLQNDLAEPSFGHKLVRLG